MLVGVSGTPKTQYSARRHGSEPANDDNDANTLHSDGHPSGCTRVTQESCE